MNLDIFPEVYTVLKYGKNQPLCYMKLPDFYKECDKGVIVELAKNHFSKW